MSLDARYIFVYENLPYVEPTPMEKDISYLKGKYGGNFEFIECTTIFWDKPKHTLDVDEIKNLYADQILERKDCEMWEILNKEK